MLKKYQNFTEDKSFVREKNPTQEKIFTSYRRLITCSRRKKSFVTKGFLNMRPTHASMPNLGILKNGNGEKEKWEF
jgi:hypothetical protein